VSISDTVTTLKILDSPGLEVNILRGWGLNADAKDNVMGLNLTGHNLGL